MGLIKKQVREERKAIPLKLEVGLLEQLNQYAEFYNGTREYVVSEILKYALKKDVEFAAWREANQISKQISETPKSGTRKPAPPAEVIPQTKGI